MALHCFPNISRVLQTSLGKLFHAVAAVIDEAWTLVDAGWATLSGGTANRWQIEDCSWPKGTYGGIQSIRYMTLGCKEI